MMNVFVYGAGGHGKVVVDTICNGQIPYRVTQLIDDDLGLQGRSLLGYPIRGANAIGAEFGFVAIGDNETRVRIASRFGGRLVSLVHRNATLGRDVLLGEGSILMAGAIVNVGSIIGANVIVNTAATVDHDCAIGDGVHLAPGCHLCGNVVVGEGALLGVGTLVVPGIRIGRKAFIHAGLTITRNVPDGATVRASKGAPGDGTSESLDLASHRSGGAHG